MKKTALIFFFALMTIVSGQTIDELKEDNKSLDTNKVLTPEIVHPKVNQVVAGIISRFHYEYSGKRLNDSLSSEIFDNYIKALDYNKMYFLKEDIDRLEKYRYALDQFLYTGELEPAFDIFNTFKKRLNERMPFLFATLEKDYDYTADDSLKLDRDEAPWAENIDELDKIWEKRIKYEKLNRILNDTPEEDIVKGLTNRYKNYHKAILQYKSEDVFQLYLNSYTNVMDPHTSYFSPITSENFQINMSLSLEGIGAQLRSENDYVTVVKIIPGGPAAKSNDLFADDRIVAVGQGDDGDMVDVIGWRLDDVVQMIRGKKGTKVRLNVLRAEDAPGMPSEEVVLIRDKVKLEEQAAKKEIIFIEEDGIKFKLGVIDLPAFYIDFEGRRNGDADYKSTTRDVAKLLEELKEEKVDGVIIDLRNNGGGSLEEVINMTGLFIEEGPVVQVKKQSGYIDVKNDPDKSILYDGPLAVLVNRYSASASEIFSGAIQDYGRGVIIGENTFGKGTVQHLDNLNRYLPGVRERLGQIKITREKYYRITGSSTQNLGVKPDIEFPSSVDSEDFGESSRPSSLAWDQIRTANFKKFQNLNDFIPELIRQHDERIQKDIEFQYLIEDIETTRIAREKEYISLNLDSRKAEIEKQEKIKEERDAEREKRTGLKLKEKEEVAGEDVPDDDVRLVETGHILADLIQLSKDKYSVK